MDHFAEEIANQAKPGLVSEGVKQVLKIAAAVGAVLGIVGGVAYSYGSYLKDKQEYEKSKNSVVSKDEQSTSDQIKKIEKNDSALRQMGQGVMSQSAPVYKQKSKLEKLNHQLQTMMLNLGSQIAEEVQISGLLTAELLMQIDEAVYEVARPMILKAVEFSTSNRRDIIWRQVSHIQESNSKKKADQMLATIIQKFDEQLFSILVTISANEQNAIKMAIENATGDTLDMLELSQDVYAESVHSSADLIPQLRQMSQMKMQQIITEGDGNTFIDENIAVQILKESLIFKTKSFQELTPILEIISKNCKI